MFDTLPERSAVMMLGADGSTATHQVAPESGESSNGPRNVVGQGPPRLHVVPTAVILWFLVVRGASR
jgi:hypothetical protein